jgi:putative aldouronate transport system substrate-binding protein
MRTKSKHFVTGSTAVLLTAALLSACTNSAAPEESKNSPAQGTTQPLTNLTYFLEMNNNAAPNFKNYNEREAYKELEKRTGVKVEYVHPPVGPDQVKQGLNLMIASNNLTDVIDFNWLTYPGGPEKAINDGVIIDLKDLIEKHAPNLNKILKEHPEVKKQISTDSGKIYSFPDLNLQKEQLTYTGPAIRQDWLDKLGLTAPTTVDEWYTVLKAFKEKDPNGNGKPDEIPFNTNGNFWFKDSSFLVGAWGIGHEFYQDKGVVKYGATQPEFKEFVITMQKWYKEGLLDPEYAINDEKLFDAKVTGDRIGSTLLLAGGGVGKFNQLMKDKNPKFVMQGIPYPTLKKGDTAALGQKVNYFTGLGAAITKANKNPIETVKYLDYRYGEEGNLLFNFGIEGVSYKMVNGYPTYTDEILKNPQGMPMAQALSKYHGSSPKLIDVRYNEQYSWTTPVLKESVKRWSEALNEMKMPPVTPSPEESAKFSSIMNDVNTYMGEMFNKFVMGAEPIENYDTFIKKLKSLNIDEATKIQQDALDRYNKR